MASFLCYLLSIRLLFLLPLFHAIATDCFASRQLLCHDDESSALLQFKESFIMNKNACINPSGYPKIASWKLEGMDRDCCSWDGVECNDDTGHVIGLDVSNGCLYGSMVSNSSLFRLVQLRRLNLAHNNFNFSQIPSGFSHLSSLTYLNLSNSSFSGQIPPKISELSKLSSIDLSYNFMLLLRSLKGLVQNLTNLSNLHLSYVQISSPVPEILSNAPYLETLFLVGCGLYGQFPVGIFKLPKLQYLRVGYNQDLTGYLPEFYSTSPFQILGVRYTTFSGKLPASIANLDSLHQLWIGSCNFSGHIPPSLGNLTQLNTLELSNNSFMGQIAPTLSNLISLNIFLCSGYQFSGSISSSFGNLTQLTGLVLDSNNLSHFPNFLRNQTQLFYVDLSYNNIHGQIPKWVWNTSKETMRYLDFSHNLLTGFDYHLVNFPWPQLQVLDFRSNKLQALPQNPPPLTLVYLVADNELQGEISPLICNLSSIYSLDFSNNKFRGILPRCLSNLSNSLNILNLRGNNFHGMIPQLCAKGSRMSERN